MPIWRVWQPLLSAGCRRKFCGFCCSSSRGDEFFHFCSCRNPPFSLFNWNHRLWIYTFPCPQAKSSVSVGVTLIMETTAYILGLKSPRHTDVTPDHNSWWNTIFQDETTSWILVCYMTTEVWLFEISRIILRSKTEFVTYRICLKPHALVSKVAFSSVFPCIMSSSF